jgi:hypothetical protein
MKGKQTPKSCGAVPSPPKVSPATRQYYPKSLSVLDMLKMGKVVDKKSTTVITLHSFNIELMAWNKIPTTVEFVVDEQELGSGGFRTAFKATTQHPMYANTTWVVKRYLPEAKVLIQETNQNIEAHTKKAVQMHVLARNFARQLKKVMASSVDSQYGPSLQYNKVYFGMTDGNECVTVEEYVDGKFIKYINNDGISCVEQSDDMCQKAHCLAHFSYERSDKKLIILDIQGSGHTLFDPEIATSELFDKDSEMLFCSGNLSMVAIKNFVKEHQCNNYCISAGLTKFK